MRVPFYDIRAQHEELKDELETAVLKVLSSGSFVMGENHNALERELAELHRCKHGIGVNSGTDALRILLDASGVGPGDEVITTAFTFVASAEVIMQTGARPVFVDIDERTWQMDPSKIEEAITPKTKAIMPIHLFGQMCLMEDLVEIAQRWNLLIIEDAAQAICSSRNGTPAGGFGIGAGFSFYVTKNLGAAGDAGMILTSDDEIAGKCRSIRVHGMGRERYYYDHIGYTSRLAEIQAAVLRVKLTRLETWNARRAELARIYFEMLEDSDVQLPVILSGNDTTWHQFSVLTPQRDELQKHLKENGVDSMIYYPVPLHFHTPYRTLAEEGSLPVTEQTCRQILSLPIHPHLSEEQVRHAAEQVREFAAQTVAS